MSKRPNILLLCTDQQRWDTLGATGNPYVNTPDIDRLYAEGAAVPHAYCQSPVCTPSRASFMTGRYPRTTGAYQNGQDLPPRERLISRILSEAGYACGLAGKLHVSACNPSIAPVHEPRHNDGFDSFHWSHHPSSSVRDQIDGTATDSAPNWPLNAHNMWLAERGKAYATEAFPDCAHIRIGPEAEDHQTTFCAEMARNFIQAHDISDTPWMYMVNFFDPHHPFDPPKAYLDRYLDQLDDLPLPSYRAGELEGKPPLQKKDHESAYCGLAALPYPEMTERDHRYVRAAYFAMCDLVSDQVGRIIEMLKETGQADDTLIVFMSDHGELLGDHGIYLKGPFFYEPSVHVPLVFHWPGRIRQGEVQGLVELVDLVPTLLDAVGLPPEQGVQGRSLWPQLTGKSREPHREDIYCEYYNAMPWHDDIGGANLTMLRTDTAKIVVQHGAGPGELYDLTKDPGEHVNLWDDAEASALQSALLKRLCDRMAGTIDPIAPRRAVW